MATKQQDITTKYILDISEFKKGIKESNQAIKEATAQFKATSSSMDNWEKSTEGLTAKISQLESILNSQKSKLEIYKAQLKATEDASAENGKRAAELRAKLNDLADNGVSKTSNEYKSYQKALNDAEKEQEANEKAANDLKITILNQEAVVNSTKKDIDNYKGALSNLENEQNKTKTATEKLTDTIESQQKELNELKSKYQNVILEQGKNSDEAKKLSSEIGDLSKKLQENKNKLDDTKKATDNLDESLDNLSTEKASNGFTVIKGALASLVADGIRKAIEAFKDLTQESITASNKLQARIGATDEEMSQFNKEMQNVYNNNYGESLQDVGDKMAYIKQVTGEVDPSKIGKLTENAIALEDTFGSDFNETVRGVSNLMNHFGIDSEVAFDLFAKGSQLGLDYTSELGDNIAEYGGNFQQAGYSAEEYFQLLVNGSKGGAYNLDKVNDSVNEIKNRLGDGTIEENLGMFSKETQEAFKEWKNGQGTMKDVIDSIVGDISNCSNEQEKLAMAATAFGTMGEDANLKVVQSLNTVGDDFKEVKGTMESVKDVRYDDVGSSLSELGRTLKSELLQPIVDTVAPKIKDFINWILDNLPVVSPIVIGLASAFGVLATALAVEGIINGAAKAMAFLNTTLLANPIVLIVAAIAGLVAAFIGLWNNCEGFRNFWIGLWEKIKDTCSSAWEEIKGFFEGLGKWFNAKFIEAKDGIVNAWGAITEFFSNIWEGIKSIFASINSWFIEKFTIAKEGIENVFITIAQWFYDNVVEPIKSFFQPLFNWFAELFTSIGNFIKSVFEVITQLSEGCWNAIVLIWGIVANWFNEHIVQPLTEFFTSLWNSIKEKAQNTWNGIVNIWNVVSGWFDEHVIQPLKNFFQGLWDKLSEWQLNAYNKILGVWEQLKSWFSEHVTEPVKNFFGDMWNNLKDGAKKAWDGIKEVFGKVKDWFKEKFEGAWTAVKDVFSTGGKIFDGIKEGIVDAFRNIVNGIIRGINKVVAIPFNAINTALDNIRNISIAGAQPFSGLISRISVPKIPELQTGGVLKKGQVGLLEGNGAEAVVPLERNKYWIRKVADELRSQLFNLEGNLANASNLVANSNVNNFTQIINAPKQPSRIELYRQTRNLLKLKGV